MDSKEILEDKLLGTYISRFSVGDTWQLCFGDYWLVSQNIIFDEESFLNQWIYDNLPLSKISIDREYISKCAIIAANLRKAVTELELDELYNLTIKFENGSKVFIPTSQDTVDWQWCINATGVDPYRSYLIACFWKGEIAIDENFKIL